MNENIYPYFNLNFNSEKEYKSNDFNLQKYEKFQPKETRSLIKNKTLKGVENKVKNLLSKFLKNYEMEKQNSDILYDSNKSPIKDNYPNTKQNKRGLKKVMTVANNGKEKIIRSNSFNISLNNENKSNKINAVNEHHHHNHSQRKKVGFNFNSNQAGHREPNLLVNRKKSKKKTSIKNKNVNFKISKTIKSKKNLMSI